MTLFRVFMAAMITGWVLALGMCAQQARAEDLPMLEALSHGKDTNRLPLWLTLDDDWAVKWRSGRVYGCFTDRATGSRWTSWAGAGTAQSYMVKGSWLFAAPVATSYDDQRICWPDLPAVTGPKALGEPAYLNLVCPDGCQEGKPLDWVAMNRPANIAGATVKGEACGPATGLGFYELRRLQKTALVPVTRCAP